MNKPSESLTIREPIVGMLYRKSQRYHHPFVAWFQVDEGLEAKRSKYIENGSIMMYLGKADRRNDVAAKAFLHEGDVVLAYSNNVLDVLEEVQPS